MRKKPIVWAGVVPASLFFGVLAFLYAPGFERRLARASGLGVSGWYSVGFVIFALFLGAFVAHKTSHLAF